MDISKLNQSIKKKLDDSLEREGLFNDDNPTYFGWEL
jgi:hypothetical protein